MVDRDSRLVKMNRQLLKRERMGRGRGPWRLSVRRGAAGLEVCRGTARGRPRREGVGR